MADINITRKHSRNLGELHVAVAQAAREYGSKYGITCSRSGDTWVINGTGVKKGRLSITSSEIAILVDVAWWVPKNTVAKAVRNKVDEILS